MARTFLISADDAAPLAEELDRAIDNDSFLELRINDDDTISFREVGQRKEIGVTEVEVEDE